jgi:hypothetical protein
LTAGGVSANVRRMRRLAWALALCAFVAPALAHASQPSPEQILAAAEQQLEYGDYEGIVAALGPIAEDGGRSLPSRLDRVEALRVYGIASALLNHKVAAEGAFLQMLDEKPDIRFDPKRIRPEAVALLESVRMRFPPVRQPLLRLPLSPEMKWGTALIVTGGSIGAVGVVTGLTALALEYSQSGAANWGKVVPAVLLTNSLVITAIGVGLLVHGNRLQKAGTY